MAKKPIVVPKEVKVALKNGSVLLEGPKGKLQFHIPLNVKVEFKDGQLHVTRDSDEKQTKASHGTARARLASMVEGLIKGHRRDLEISGIGFRANLQGKKINFNLGLSHPIEIEVPEDVKVTVPTQTNITVEGPDSQRVGEIAAKIRGLKPAEPYKAKGIRYIDEVIRRKQGKSVTK